MLKIFKIALSIILLNLIPLINANASCPDIATAIKQINGISNLSTGMLQDNFTSYTGTSSFDKSTVTYYTITAPTAVGPVRQLKLLEAALATGVQLPPASANDTSVSCVYLGSMTGNSDKPVPVVDTGWQQIVLIKSSEVVPSQVQVSTNVTGLPAGVSVQVSIENADKSVKISQTVSNGIALFATVPSGTYTVTAAAFQDYTATIPNNPVTITVATTIAINYSQSGPPTPVNGEIVYSVTFPVVPGAPGQQILPLNTVYQDLVVSNLIAGALYGHMLSSLVPTLAYDKGYIMGSLFGQLMQESGNYLSSYPSVKQSGSSLINTPADAAYLLQPNSGGPYQLNGYPARGYDKASGGVGLINFIALQKNLGYTIEAQDANPNVPPKNPASQANKNGPLMLDNKYFGPIAAAYYHYNDFLQLQYYYNKSPTWINCVANLTASTSPLEILDLIQNAVYNSGPFGNMFEAFNAICAAPTTGGQSTLAFTSMDNYTLDPTTYLNNIGAPPTTLNFYYLYPRQIRFYVDQLYNNQNRMPAGTFTLNNSMPISMQMLRGVFENIMSTMSYISASGVYGYIGLRDIDVAFSSALATVGLTSNTILNLNSPMDRIKLFTLLDQSFSNLEKNLNFKFTATTEKNLWQ